MVNPTKPGHAPNDEELDVTAMVTAGDDTCCIDITSCGLELWASGLRLEALGLRFWASGFGFKA